MSLTRKAALLVTSLVLSLSALAAPPKLIKKVPPEFPREASSKGINTGTVRVRLHIETDGSVGKVEILEAEPKRVFDRAVHEALKAWKFEAASEKTTHEMKLVFQNED